MAPLSLLASASQRLAVGAGSGRPRPHGRSNVVLVAAQQQEQRRIVATQASPRPFSAGVAGQQGGGSQSSSWLPNLHLFFTSSSQHQVSTSPSFEAW